MRLVFATRNAHKLLEVRALLTDPRAGNLADLRLLDLDEAGIAGDPPETGDTFEDNALEKARWVAERLPDGLADACLADDSGLEVDALGGAPGVRSKRFSPEATAAANNALLLQRLGGRPDRAARFRCVLALVGPGRPDLVVEGGCEGAIASAGRGTAGFGYDPLFLPAEAPGRTLAELTMVEKNAISHRGRAMRALAAALRR